MKSESQKTSSAYADLLTVTTFISWSAVGVAIFYTISRLHFGFHFTAQLKTVSLLLLIVNGPVFWTVFRPRNPDDHSFFAHFAGGTVLLLALSGLSGSALQHCPELPFWILVTLLGLTAFIVSLRILIRNRSAKTCIYILILSGLFSFWLCGRMWGPHILHPLFLERLVQGYGFIDTLFHQAIIHMIEIHNSASTGVDGLAGLNYYVGSHWLFAQWARLLQVPVPVLFPMAYSIILMPVYTYAVLLFGLYTGRTFFQLDLSGSQGKIFWLLFFALTIRLLPERLLNQLLVWESFAFSPSGFLGLALLFFLLILYIGSERNQTALTKTTYRILRYLVLMPILIGLHGLVKNFIPFFMITAYGFYLIRTQKILDPIRLCGLILSACAAVCAFMATRSVTGISEGFRLFAFIREYLPIHLLPYHVLAYFGFSLLYVVVRTHHADIRNWTTLKLALKQRRILDLEMLVIIIFMGILPGAILDTAEGSAHQIADLQFRLALPLLLSCSGLIYNAITTLSQSGWKPVLRGLLIVAIATLVYKAFMITGFYFKTQIKIQKEISSIHGRGGTPDSSIKKRMAFLQSLDHIGERSNEWKANTLIHVSKADSFYWNRFLEHERDQAISLLVPAITGIAMLDGIPPDTVALSGYGFNNPKLRNRIPLADESESTLCMAAAERNFTRATILHYSCSESEPDTICCSPIIR